MTMCGGWQEGKGVAGWKKFLRGNHGILLRVFSLVGLVLSATKWINSWKYSLVSVLRCMSTRI